LNFDREHAVAYIFNEPGGAKRRIQVKEIVQNASGIGIFCKEDEVSFFLFIKTSLPMSKLQDIKKGTFIYKIGNVTFNSTYNTGVWILENKPFRNKKALWLMFSDYVTANGFKGSEKEIAGGTMFIIYE
jgi:hypothetical protein